VVENYRKKVLGGFAWEAGTKVFVQILSWISTILVARVLSPDDYGLVLISGIFTGLVGMIAGLGVSSGMVQRDSVSHEDASTVFWLSVILGSFFYALLFSASGFIADFYSEPDLIAIIRVAGLVVVLSCVNIVPHALMMRELQFRFEAITDMFSKFILITITIIMAYSGYGYWSLITSTVVSQAFILVVYLMALKRRPSLHFNFSKVVDVIRFGLTVLMSRLLMWWNGSSAGTIVSVMLDKVVAGHLQMASTLATIPLSKIGEIFDKIAFPSIAAIKGDKQRAKEVFLLMHQYLLLITVPMFVGIAVISKEIVTLFLGEQWLPIIIPLQILCFSNIVRVSNQLVPRVLEGIGQPKASVWFQLLMGIVCPIGMLIGSSHGLTGVLTGWLVTLPLIYIFLVRLAQRSLQLTYLEFFATVWPPLLGGTLILITGMSVDFLLPDLNVITALWAKIPLCIFVFVGFYFLFRRSQIMQIIEQFKSIKK